MMIGLAIERGRVRAVGVRRGRVMWGVDGALDPTSPLADTLALFVRSLLLRRSPLGRWRSPPVTVALGGAFAQTKRLAGLPPITDERVLTRTVHEHAARFFLKNGVPLVTTTVRVDASGSLWAAALDQTVVAALERSCHAARVRLRGIVSAADVVGYGLVIPAGGSLLWDELGARSMLTWAGGRLASLVRVADSMPATAPPMAAPALAVLGADAWRFAAAYGAAIAGGSPVGGSPALMWRGGPQAEATAPRRRLVLSVTPAALALLALLLAPGLTARRVERRAVAHLTAVSTLRRGAERTQRDVGQVTSALGEMAAFESGARPATLFIAALARILPSGAALVAIHVDSAGGSIVALAPRAGDLLARVETVPGVLAPDIVSPVTRETAGGRALERVTVRFRWRRP